ncbi:hypothetical protein YQE_10910, partial [Dendroctonus ponderosae]
MGSPAPRRIFPDFRSTIAGFLAGVINTSGKLWKEQRRFVHDGLRHFGMSYLSSRKARMEKRIVSEVDDFLQILQAANGEPLDLNPVLAVSISNVICDVLMSVKFSHNDSRFIRFMELIEEGFQLFGSLEYVFFIPILRYLPGHSKTRQKIAKVTTQPPNLRLKTSKPPPPQNREEMAQFFQEVIDDHKKTFDPSHLRDLLDTYLFAIQKAKEEGVADHLFEGKDHDRQMQQIIGDMFSAGMETIKSSLHWAVLFMMHNPEHMRAAQEELDQVVGRLRLPKLEDLAYLPVTESTILEVLRISSIVPMGTTHSPIRDIKLNGFHLPRHAQVVPLLHAVHMDATLWAEPQRFDPSRFINAEGKVHKPEFFLPFGVGRRMCLGEVMARMEIFLFFSSLLHSFDVRVPAGETLPSLKGIVGVTISPNPYKVCLKPRPLGAEGVRAAGAR